MTTTGKATTPRRRYRSQLRGQQAGETKRAIVVAARELFIANGWAGTGMREVATAAGVALETVYSHFSSKKGLLRAVIDESAVGDDEPVPLAQRPEFVAMGEGSRSARFRAGARVVSAIHERTAGIAKLLRDGARADADVAEMLQATRERQRLDTGAAVGLLLGRPATADERDGAWALTSPEVYLLLVEGSGWTTAQYEAWIEAALERVLPRS